MDRVGATIGLIMEDANGARTADLAPLPSVSPSLNQLLNTCSTILVDGTFWSEDELQIIQPGNTSGPLHGPSTHQRVRWLTRKPSRPGRYPQIYTHIHNTKPILKEQSSERRAVQDAGWEVAWDGLEITTWCSQRRVCLARPSCVSASSRWARRCTITNTHFICACTLAGSPAVRRRPGR
jgi:hypothetical protein